MGAMEETGCLAVALAQEGGGAPAVIEPNKCWRAMADASELDNCAPRGGGEDGTTGPTPLVEAQGFVCPEAIAVETVTH